MGALSKRDCAEIWIYTMKTRPFPSDVIIVNFIFIFRSSIQWWDMFDIFLGVKVKKDCNSLKKMDFTEKIQIQCITLVSRKKLFFFSDCSRHFLDASENGDAIKRDVIDKNSSILWYVKKTIVF